MNEYIIVARETTNGDIRVQNRKRNIKGGLMMKGFTFYLNGKDYFYETEKTYKTNVLAGEILRGFSFPDNVANRTILLLKLKRAECELKTLSNGKQMWDIHGDGFGGYGSFVGDGRTVVLRAKLADA